MLLYVSGVNYNVNSNYTLYKVFGTTLRLIIFTLWKISIANLRILWRHLPIYYETFSDL